MSLKKRTFPGSRSAEVTERERRNRAVSRELAAEGIVLLKNDNNTLPVPQGSRIALYGAGADYTVKGGTGSGDVNERDSVTVRQGLENAGYEITSRSWLAAYAAAYTAAREQWKAEVLAKAEECGNFFAAYSTMPFTAPAGPGLDTEACRADGAETAVFVLRRVAGEGADRKAAPGDYYLSEGEQSLLEQVCEAYSKVVLVLNTGGAVDLSCLDALPNITAVLLLGQAGQEGGNALADIISGAVSPSGKLTDTWALRYEDYPGAAAFAAGEGWTERYEEGIFVGYRYFDSFRVPVRYGFGFGLSYTSFEISCTGLRAEGSRVILTAAVRNTGTHSGREVVQLYAACPQTGLRKEYRRLCAFGKTSLLAPGAEETLALSFPMESLASYDEAGACFLLEKGMYGLWLGSSLQGAKPAGSLCLSETVKTLQCKNICPLQEALTETAPPEPADSCPREAGTAYRVDIPAGAIPTRTADYSAIGTVSPRAEAAAGRLSPEELTAMVIGDPSKEQGIVLGSAGQSVPGAAAETVALPFAEDPIPGMVLADGPAGLRLKRSYEVRDGRPVPTDIRNSLAGGFFAEAAEPAGEVYYQYCTALPVGTVLAQTWNADALYRAGALVGEELELFGVTLWLAPGMNIHRNPLCGRNFEYYSEDPLLSGKAAAAITRGVQSVPGVGTTIKHFACNNREDNRLGSDTVLSERALREIYLRSFEIAVKEAQPMAIMTSYNMVNGVHTANSYDLCTRAARCEWGFRGLIMTDWTTTTGSTAGHCDAKGCILAGNDLIMPGHKKDFQSIGEGLTDGTLPLETLRLSAARVMDIALQSNQMEGAVPYRKSTCRWTWS